MDTSIMTTLQPDHLIYAVPDLAAAVVELAARFGVRPTPGGKHPHGTHNALLSLGDACYLEIIAPDPEQPTPDRPLSFGLNHRTEPRLVTWAAAAPALEQVIAAARRRGYDPGAIIEGSRARPDGVHLAWRSSKRSEALRGWPPPGHGLVPFLIQWSAGTPHPARTSAQGCRLLALRAEHPEPETVLALLAALGVELTVTPGPTPTLIATIESPNGVVELC